MNYTQQSLAHNRKSYNYSVWKYILKLLLIIGFSLICFSFFGAFSDSPLSSFISSSIAFLTITIFSTVLLLKDRKWVWFFTLAYLIKVLIGLFHYLYFIDPDYFTTGLYSPLTFEYDGVYNQIIAFAHDKLEHGILYYSFTEGGVTHQEILSIISIPFMFFGDYVLTITPINTFSSLLISMIIILISKYNYFYNNNKLKIIALLTSYFPITLISSLLYRDIVGLALMSIGLSLVLFSKRIFVQYLMLAIACYLFYLQRTAYPFILFLAYIFNFVLGGNFKNSNKAKFYKVSTIILGLIVLPFIINNINSDVNQDMLSSGLSFSFILLPIKMLVGLIGPFPWLNFLFYKTIPAYSYQLQDYIQGTLQIAILFSVLLKWRKYFKKDSIDLLSITGLLLILVGLFTSYMHSSYVAIGFVFIIPIFIDRVDIRKFRKTFFFSLLVLLLLNIAVISFIGNVGISSLWK